MLLKGIFLINPRLLQASRSLASRGVFFRAASTAAITAKKEDFELHGRRTVKPMNSRKTFLIDYYKNMMETNPVVIFVHYNNLIKTEDHYFRHQIKNTNGKLHKLRNSLFQVYLKRSELKDPCAPIEEDIKLLENHPLLPLFCGPTAAITFKNINPSDIASLIKVLNLAKDKLFIIGAKVDTDVLDVKQVSNFSKLPSLPQLQAQLVSLLQMSGGVNLVQTLEFASQKLYLTLKSHEDNVNKPQETEEEVKASEETK